MIRGTLNNQVWKQKESFNIIEIAIHCVSPLPKDHKTRFEAEILTTGFLEIDLWYKGKDNLIMSIKTNLRKLN